MLAVQRNIWKPCSLGGLLAWWHSPCLSTAAALVLPQPLHIPTCYSGHLLWRLPFQPLFMPKAKKQSFSVTYLPLQISSFIRRGSREDSRVTEAGPKQSPHHKEEQDATNHGDGRGDFLCEVPTAASRVQREKRNELQC